MIRHAVLAALVFACARPAPTPATAAPPTAESAPAVQSLDLSRPGTFTSGRWEYRFTIVAEGSKSEGERGELLYDGQPLPPAAPGDFYATPWGDIAWVGDSPMLWGPNGWMPREPASSTGKLLSPPQ